MSVLIELCEGVLRPLALAASVVIAFAVPPGLGPWDVLGWGTLGIVRIYCSKTVVEVPHVAWAVEREKFCWDNEAVLSQFNSWVTVYGRFGGQIWKAL